MPLASEDVARNSNLRCFCFIGISLEAILKFVGFDYGVKAISGRQLDL